MTNYTLKGDTPMIVSDTTNTSTSYHIPCDIRMAQPKPYDELILEQLGDSAIELLAKEVARRRAAEIRDLTDQVAKYRKVHEADGLTFDKMTEMKNAYRAERDALQERCNQAERKCEIFSKALEERNAEIRKLQRRRARNAA